jgi:FkbM family methyltransferase
MHQLMHSLPVLRDYLGWAHTNLGIGPALLTFVSAQARRDRCVRLRVHDEIDVAIRPGTATVAAFSLPNLLAQYRFPRVDVLKMDIEGAEVKVLRHAV